MEMLPVWSILLIPLFTAFFIVLFLQRFDRAAAAVAITSISACFLLTLALPRMTIPADHPAATRDLALVEGDPSEAYVYRVYPTQEVEIQGSERAVRGWQIRPQKSVVSWAVVEAKRGLSDQALPLGVPEARSEEGLNLELGVMLDNLAFFMLFVVTFVALLVHIFSLGYLAHEDSWGRYFAGLQLFCFSMLGIVLSPNYIQTFLFWELVGVSSYILIGHHFQKNGPPDASKKAFMTNRVADFGFMIGILLLFSETGTLDFAALASFPDLFPVEYGPEASSAWTWMGILLFVGCMGKSAQFPFHIWLPDAMAGPTPVSALMHAATMVAAGVYLVLRSYPVYNDGALQVIAYVGILTAVLAAGIALVQNDIKKVLAYSTLSQLGYMMMGLGLAGFASHAVEHGSGITVEMFRSQCFTTGMFHLTTHAFFKALLFLSAGAVIVGMHHQQDMRQMGGLARRMPLTAACFAIGTLALAGFPFFAGFYSKDLILHLAHQAHPGLSSLATFAAGLTAFYMGRCYCLTFFGSARTKAAREAEEVDATMWVPLVILAVFSCLSGYFGYYGMPGFPAENQGALRPFSMLVFHQMAWWPEPLSRAVYLKSFLLSAGAFLVAAMMYYRPAYGASTLPAIPRDWYQSVPGLPTLYTLLENKFYCDEIAMFLVRKVQDTLAGILNLIEQILLIELGVFGLAAGFRRVGGVLRYSQTGNVRTYASLLLLGTVFVVFLVNFSRTLLFAKGG